MVDATLAGSLLKRVSKGKFVLASINVAYPIAGWDKYTVGQNWSAAASIPGLTLTTASIYMIPMDSMCRSAAKK
jgi:hypothetical protein